MRIIIISGLSGSGKSIALQTLEDEGFYCIDNLPLSFLAEFIERFRSARPENKVAVSVDVRGFIDDLHRSREFLTDLKAVYEFVEIIFLQASDQVLLKRFHETRRKHPLSDTTIDLVKAISLERRMLETLLSEANLVIDTSAFNVHELRAALKSSLLAQGKSRALAIQLESFGFKNGVPMNADFMFDARALPNPHWDPALRELTGRDPAVQSFFDNEEKVQHYLKTLQQALLAWLVDIENSNRSYLTITIGCTGGQHRSVYLIERLCQFLQMSGRHALVRHRELDR